MNDTHIDFKHPPLNEAIYSIGGEYRFNDERRVSGVGGEILYYTGFFMIDRSCCGVAGCAYAMVAGLIVNWKCETSKDGVAVSRVLPIKKQRDRERIIKMIKKEDALCQVVFYE
jgi:hypothetical protein